MKKTEFYDLALPRLRAMIPTIEQFKKSVADLHRPVLFTDDEIKNGARVARFYCFDCGKTGPIKSGHYWSYCPYCKNPMKTYGPSYFSAGSAPFAVVKDDALAFINLTIRWTFPSKDIPDWFMKEPEMELIPQTAGLFDKEMGWFLYDFSQEKLIKSSYDKRYRIDNFLNTKPCNTVGPEFAVAVQSAKDITSAIKKEAEMKKANSKSATLETLRLNYKARDFAFSEVINNMHTICEITENMANNEISHTRLYCSKCGHEWVMANDGREQNCCPHCGFKAERNFKNSASIYVSTPQFPEDIKRQYVITFESTRLPENDLLIRLFCVALHYDNAPTFCEEQRIFAGKKLLVYDYKASKKQWVKRTIRDIDPKLQYSTAYWSIHAPVAIQKDEELSREICNSCMAESGLVKSFKWNKKTGGKTPNTYNLSYLLAWYKNPDVKKLLDADLNTLLQYYVQRPDELAEGDSLEHVLMTTSQALQIAKDLDCDRRALCDITALCRSDPTMTTKTFEELENELQKNGTSIQNFAHFCRLNDFSSNEALTYIKHVEDTQFIGRAEALRLWTSYLNCAKSLKLPLSPAQKEPNSLKLEYDRLYFVEDTVYRSKNNPDFAEKASYRQHLRWEDDKYEIFVPENMAESMTASLIMQNCTRSFVMSVESGDVFPVFVKNKLHPDVSCALVLLKDNTIVQMHGVGNAGIYKASTPELGSFIEEWTKLKNLSVNIK